MLCLVAVRFVCCVGLRFLLLLFIVVVIVCSWLRWDVGLQQRVAWLVRWLCGCV